MVAGRRDVGGRCIKARGLPEPSQQPGAVTEPPEPGREAPGRRTGPEDQGQRDACSGTAGDSGGPARAVPAAHNCSRCTRTFLFWGFFLKLFKLLPLPPTPPAAKGKKKEEGKRLERKHRFATPKKNRGGKEKRKVQRLWGLHGGSRSVGRAMWGCAPRRPRVATGATMHGQAR